LSKDSISI